MSICKTGYFKVDVTVDSAKFAGGRQTVSVRFWTFGVVTPGLGLVTEGDFSLPI